MLAINLAFYDKKYVHTRGVGVGRRPFFRCLNLVSTFNHSDRMRVRLPIVSADSQFLVFASVSLAVIGLFSI